MGTDELILVTFRPHWWVLRGPMVATALAVASSAAFVVALPEAPVVVVWGLSAWVGLPVAWLGGRMLKRSTTRLAVTTARIEHHSGVVRRRSEQVRLARVQEVHLDRSLAERLFGSGRLVLDLENGGRMVIGDVPDAADVANLVTDALGGPRTPPRGVTVRGCTDARPVGT